MKLLKTASGKQTIKLSKKEWQSIGKKAGWMKKAKIDISKAPKLVEWYGEYDASRALSSIGTEEVEWWLEDLNSTTFPEESTSKSAARDEFYKLMMSERDEMDNKPDRSVIPDGWANDHRRRNRDR